MIMTREEEIQKLIDEETGIDNYGSSDYQVGLSDGVRLADKTMIEKAFEWLCANMVDNNYLGANTLRALNKAEFIQNFKKAMEGEV